MGALVAKRPRSKRRSTRAGRASVEALPALSSLTELPAFGELAMSDAQRAAFEDDLDVLRGEGADVREVEPACVVRLDRSFPALAAASGLCRAEFSFRFGVVREPSAAVGDWVVLRRPERHDMGVIEFVLPRESDIARWRGGSRGRMQTLAANVDEVLVVQALGAVPLSCDRMARSAVIAADCGAHVAVVLTKADRTPPAALAADVTLVREVLGGTVPIAVTCAGSRHDGATDEARAQAAAECHALWGERGVRALVPIGTVAIVLGESGAGKSTLLNALLGTSVLETQGVRERDDTGRHTTVARRMVSVPGAGIVIDEPGLRSLPIVGHERGLLKVFPEIADAANGCRFRDCTHTHEPGCEVRARFEAGAFSWARLDAYLSLAREMRTSRALLDPDVAAAPSSHG